MVSQASALERVIQPANGDLPAPLADYLLRLHLSPSDHAAYERLSEKAQDGTLSESEKIELDDLLTTNDVLTILHAKARASLRRQRPTT